VADTCEVGRCEFLLFTLAASYSLWMGSTKTRLSCYNHVIPNIGIIYPAKQCGQRELQFGDDELIWTFGQLVESEQLGRTSFAEMKANESCPKMEIKSCAASDLVSMQLSERQRPKIHIQFGEQATGNEREKVGNIEAQCEQAKQEQQVALHSQ